MKHALLLILTALVVSSPCHGTEPLWKGTVRLNNGTGFKDATIERIADGKARVNHGGTVYSIPLSDLTPATRGALGLGTPADRQAYVDQRAAELAAQKAALEEQLRQMDIQDAIRKRQQFREDEKAARRAEMDRVLDRQRRQREIEAIEAIARQLQQPRR
jgi:hypothetical protein